VTNGNRLWLLLGLSLGIEHFQGSAAGIDLVVIGEIGKPFENAEQPLVPEAGPDFHIAGPALRPDRPKTRNLVAALRRRSQIIVTEFERRQLKAIRDEIDHDFTARNAPATGATVTGGPNPFIQQ
jgi:hypothetical protein